MNPAASQRIAPSQVALILMGLLVIWLGFEFWPQKKLAPAMAPVAAESKFRISGLADNPDWDGLPQIFAIWAEHADWKDERTRFAYWHPVMKAYSYYFEATRTGGGFRFREIAEPHDQNYFWDESLGPECPILFYRPALSVITSLPPIPIIPVGNGDRGPPTKAARPESVKIPPVELKLQPPDIGKKP